MEPIACPFCRPDPAAVVLRGEAGFVLKDKFPVTPGHLLIVPHRHIPSYFDATPFEKTALWALVERAKALMDAQGRPDGCNIGVNVGEAAGQTVGHLHIHLIPRRKGDTADPRGGVRNVIPGKGGY